MAMPAPPALRAPPYMISARPMPAPRINKKNRIANELLFLILITSHRVGSLLAQNPAQKFLNALGWILCVRLRFVLVALPKQSPEHAERIVGCWHNTF